MKRHAAPIIAAILLLLPVLYVGSYLALVLPFASGRQAGAPWPAKHYRICPDMCAGFFYPLEQVDRRFRPLRWDESNRKN